LRLNNADEIKRDLEEDGHRTLGFMIYGFTYDNGDDWPTFMKRLREQIREILDFYNEMDLMNNLSLTFFKDQSLFDGADTSVICEHFKPWTVIDPQHHGHRIACFEILLGTSRNLTF
jgi:hypothetical protein